MSNRAIQRDLHNKVGEQLEELLNHELRIAQVVLPPPELAEVMLTLAAAVSASMISGFLQMSRLDADPAEAFDTSAQVLASMIAARKADVLDGVALMRSGKMDEAVAKYGAGSR